MKKILSLCLATVITLLAFVGCGKSDKGSSSSEKELSVKIVDDTGNFFDLKCDMDISEIIEKMGDYSESETVEGVRDCDTVYYWYYRKVNSFEQIEGAAPIEPYPSNGTDYYAYLKVNTKFDKATKLTYHFEEMTLEEVVEVQLNVESGQEYGRDGTTIVVPNHTRFGTKVEVKTSLHHETTDVVVHNKNVISDIILN